MSRDLMSVSGIFLLKRLFSRYVLSIYESHRIVFMFSVIASITLLLNIKIVNFYRYQETHLRSLA